MKEWKPASVSLESYGVIKIEDEDGKVLPLPARPFNRNICDG